MDERNARRALQYLGIAPTKGLIRSWILATQAEELEELQSDAPRQPPKPSPTSRPSVLADSRARRPRGYSKSRLEPVLREQGALERKPGQAKAWQARSCGELVQRARGSNG